MDIDTNAHTGHSAWPRRPRRGGRVAALLSVALLLGACGGNDGDGDGAAPPATPSATATSVSDDATAVTPSASDVSTASTDEPTDASTESTESGPGSTQAPIPVPTVGPPPPTTVPLPRPIEPPPDDGSRDPEVQLGRVAIPAIGIDSPMFEGIRLPTFDLGPGHWPGSAMPGQIGNMIIGGHRTEGNADFRDLDELEPGDEVVVTMGDGAAYTYLVRSTEIVDPFAARVLNQTPEKTATLFACHPPGSIKQRIVVHLALAA